MTNTNPDEFLETDSLPSPHDLRYILQSRIAEVTFEKQDGSIRVMNCTLMPETLKPFFKPDVDKVNTAPRPNLFKVLDTDINEFRSFNFDQVISWK